MKQTFLLPFIMLIGLCSHKMAAQALHFDGSNDHITLPAALGTALRGIPAGVQQTYEFWYKGTNCQSVIRLENSTAWAVRLPYNNGGNYEHTIWGKLSNNGGVSAGTNIHDGNWHHIAFTWKAGVPMRSYVDGVQVAVSSTNAKNVATPNGITTLVIGSNRGISEFLSGTIDELRIWSIDRTAAQIQANMNGELSGSEANLLAYYKFNEGIVNGNNAAITTLVNSAATGTTYDGTLVNFTKTGATSNWVESPIGMKNMWTGAISSDWNTSGNWSLGIVPRITDSILFAPTVTNQPTLPANATIASLTLSGTNKLSLGANDLTVTTVTGASSTAYVVTDGEGALKMNVSNTAPTTFPIGASATSYDPVTIQPSTSATFAVKVKTTNTSLDFAGPISDFSKVVKRQWRIIPTGTPGSTQITLKNGGTSFVPTNPKIGHFTSSNQWEELTATYSADTWSATTTSFSPFGAGDENGFAGVVLATELVDFKGTPSVSGNLLTWTTALENDNKGFYVEKQNDYQEWEILGFVNGLNKAGHYSFLDRQAGALSLYRLRQIDNDGSEQMSKIISVVRKETKTVVVYPNPAADVIFLDNTVEQPYQIINVFGQILKTGVTVSQVDISELPTGTYSIRLGQDAHRFTKQ